LTKSQPDKVCFGEPSDAGYAPAVDLKRQVSPMPAPETNVATSARPVPSRLPIEGPSAWVGADMREREAEWTYRKHPVKPAKR
jgi:hypothetical protein